MVRSVDVIRKELKSLDETTATLAEEFDQFYTSYLEALGRAIRQQVVLATYHLCTQVYPDAFLSLSVNQREKLQQTIRTLGQEGQQWLQQLMEASEPESPNFEDLPAEQQERISRLTAALEAIPTEDEDSEQEVAFEEEIGSERSADTEAKSSDSGKQLEAASPTIQFIAVDAAATEPSEPEGPEPEGGEPDDDGPEGAVPEDFEQKEAAPEESATEGDSSGSHSTEDQEALESSSASESNGPSSQKKMDPKSLIQSVIMAAMAEDIQETLSGRPFTGESLTPTQLAKHHLILEQRIRQVLHRLSKRANLQLKRSNVIPDLPEAVLDAAAEAETGPEKGRSMPNLLNVLVEMPSDMQNGSAQDPPTDEEDNFESDSQEEEEEAIQGMMTHLAAINLRLSDLEFADVQSSMWRSKLRTALAKLRKLGKQYQRTERELAIAEAEQAWRAVWYDDSSD
jgi:hypothetical protein